MSVDQTSSLLKITRQRCEELGIHPKRSLGQNFLVSERAVDRIIEAVKGHHPRRLVEIGPGLGALTDRLRSLGPPLDVIELDHGLATYWRRQNVSVIEHDALKVDWSRLPLVPDTLLVSNLPYQISTHLVIDRCLGPENLRWMILMFQKEVALRLLATPRTSDYGLLTPMVQTFWKVQKLLDAAPREFWPAPKVASKVLLFERKTSPFPGHEQDFLILLKAAFSQRRKFLSKNLSGVLNKFSIQINDLMEIFREMNLSPKVRAEELSPEQYQRLFLRLRGES